MPGNYSDFNRDKSSIENRSSKQMKTTDVNILLNRVKLDQKKTFKKNMLLSLLLICLVSSISFFFII